MVRLSWPVCSISRLAAPDTLMAVNRSTCRVSVLRLPEPLIVGPPYVSDQLQAATTSRDKRAAAVRSMVEISRKRRRDEMMNAVEGFKAPAQLGAGSRQRLRRRSLYC